MAVNRRKLFDIPKKLTLDEELSDWCDLIGERRNLPFARYIRILIKEHKTRCENELSAQNQADDRPKQGQNLAQSGGLYTAQQVAELINAVREGK